MPCRNRGQVYCETLTVIVIASSVLKTVWSRSLNTLFSPDHEGSTSYPFRSRDLGLKHSRFAFRHAPVRSKLWSSKYRGQRPVERCSVQRWTFTLHWRKFISIRLAVEAPCDCSAGSRLYYNTFGCRSPRQPVERQGSKLSIICARVSYFAKPSSASLPAPCACNMSPVLAKLAPSSRK